MSASSIIAGGPIPANYQLPNPNDNEGPLIRRTVWVLISISTVVLICRLWSKLRKTRRLYWDDALMTLALILGFIHAISINIGVNHGLGRHLLDLNSQQRAATIKLGVFALAFAFLSPMMGRLGFCVTLLYIARTDPRVRRWPIYMFMALQVVVNIATLIIFYTQCGNQLDIFWTPAKQMLIFTKCLNPIIQTDLGYFQGAFNTLTDAFLTALPGVLIEHTRLSVKSKIGLAFLLCLSVLAMIASIVKTYEARVLSQVLDYTYDLCILIVWQSVELNVVIIVASIPLLRPLFTRNGQYIDLKPAQRWDGSNLGSVLSRKGPRGTLSSVDSEENIIAPHGDSYPMEQQSNGIQVTTEVSVTYQASNTPFVHAALVGLVQGEIENPHLIRR